MSTLIPCNGRIVVKPDAPEEVSGSIHRPDSVRSVATTGVVVASDDPDYGVGMRVRFGDYAGMLFETEGEHHLITDRAEILGILVDVRGPLRPPPGQMFVRRRDRHHYGALIVPDSFRARQRSAIATLLDAGDFSGFDLGEVFLLSPRAGRSFLVPGVDRLSEEITRIRPEDILVRLRDVPAAEMLEYEEDPRRGLDPLFFERPVGIDLPDEGTPEAPR